MENWTITLRIRRQQQGGTAYDQCFTVQVPPEEYVLDAVERVWAYHDRSLVFRHACHHSTCGACGMRVNGRERLSCITRIADVTHDGGTLTLAPLRNFPLVADLAVDMTALYTRMDQVAARQVVPESGPEPSLARLADCIECGLCISACPVMVTALNYAGPAVLAATAQEDLDAMPARLALADSQDGLWRCHNAFECTDVCPCGVDPAARIMGLRRQVVGRRLRALFHWRKEGAR